MTCVVFGPGLVGTYLGAAAGSTVVIRRQPSAPFMPPMVQLPNGSVHWQPAELQRPGKEHSTTEPADLPWLVTTRCHQTPWDELPADALIIQNGLSQPRLVATAFMALDVVNGVLTAVGPPPRLVMAQVSARWQPVMHAWRTAGLVIEEVADPRPAQWEKAILNATVGPLTLTRQGAAATMAAVWADPMARALVLAATEEGIAIARAAGIALNAGVVARATAFFSAVGVHVPSCRRDPGELPMIHGPLLAAAARYRVAAPVLSAIARGAC